MIFFRALKVTVLGGLVIGSTVPSAVAAGGPCTQDFDCSSASSSPYCVDNECVGCRTDEDCSSSLVCAAGGDCTICLQDSDCLDYPDYGGDRRYCDNENCHYCVLDSHCSAPKPYCDQSFLYYECKECRTNSDCSAPNPYCVRGTCSVCGSDADCSAPTPYCNRGGNCVECTVFQNPCSSPEPNCLYGECRAEECLSDGDCVNPSNPDCEEGECVCFAPRSTVKILVKLDNGKSQEATIPMTDVKVNDWVLTGSGDFKRIVAFSTYNAPTNSGHAEKSLYIKIRLDPPMSHVALELTPRHMIYLADKKYPFEASKVKAGDSLFLQEHSNKPPKVVKVASVEQTCLQGGYAPLTEDGTIVVDGIVASCYSNPLYQASEYVEIFGFPVVHRHVFAHAIKSPIRLVCSYITDWPCQVSMEGKPEHLLGLVTFDKLHRWSVKCGLEDLGEILFGLLACGFFVLEWIVSKLAFTLPAVALVFAVHCSIVIRNAI